MEKPGSVSDLLAMAARTEMIWLMYSERNMNSAEKLDWMKYGIGLMQSQHLYAR